MCSPSSSSALIATNAFSSSAASIYSIIPWSIRSAHFILSSPSRTRCSSFSLDAPFSTIILGALILIVIALIAFSTYKAVQKEEEQKTQIQQIQDQADEMPPIVQEEQPEAAEKKPKKKTQKKK